MNDNEQWRAGLWGKEAAELLELAPQLAAGRRRRVDLMDFVPQWLGGNKPRNERKFKDMGKVRVPLTMPTLPSMPSFATPTLELGETTPAGFAVPEDMQGYPLEGALAVVLRSRARNNLQDLESRNIRRLNAGWQPAWGLDTRQPVLGLGPAFDGRTATRPVFMRPDGSMVDTMTSPRELQRDATLAPSVLSPSAQQRQGMLNAPVVNDGEEPEVFARAMRWPRPSVGSGVQEAVADKSAPAVPTALPKLQPGQNLIEQPFEDISTSNNFPGLKKSSRALFPKRADDSLGRSIYKHLPGWHTPDILAGAALGAAGGAATHALRSYLEPNKRKRKQLSLLNHVAAGAGLGASGLNLIGDRLRRFVSNDIPPWGYERGASAYKPDTSLFSRIWQGAILDQVPEGHKPISHPAVDGGKPMDVATHPIMTARREILRRGMNVHTNNPEKDWFVNVGIRPYESDWRSGGPSGSYRTIEFNPKTYEQLSPHLGHTLDNLRRGSGVSIDDKGRALSHFWLSKLLARHKIRQESPSTVNVSDVWDFAMDDVDKHNLKELWPAIRDKGLSRAMGERVTTDDTVFQAQQRGLRPYDGRGGATRKEWLKRLAQRGLMEYWLIGHDPMMFEQRFDVSGKTPQPIYQSLSAQDVASQ